MCSTQRKLKQQRKENIRASRVNAKVSSRHETNSLNDKKCLYLFILIRGNGNELGFDEREGLEITEGMFVRVVRSSDVNSWLVLVHRVEDSLWQK